MFKERARLERTSSVWLQRGQCWLLQVLVPQKNIQRRGTVCVCLHVCVGWGCAKSYCACGWMLLHVLDCESVPGRKNLRNGTAGLLWTLLLPYYLLRCCARALWSVIITYSPSLAANFTKLFQSMTQTDRGGEGNREGTVTRGSWLALFCSFESDVNFHLRSWCENQHGS